MRRIAGKYHPAPPPSLRVGGADVIDPATVADEIGRFLAERCFANTDDPGFAAHKRQCENSPVDFSTDCERPYNCDFTLIELDIAISSLREVAVGPDNIHNSMLKHLPPSARVLLLQAFNDLWRRHVFPDAWREAVVVPLLKPNKDGGFGLSPYLSHVLLL